MSLEIIPLDNATTLLEINNAAVPDVGVLTAVKARWLAEQVVMPGLAVLDGRQAGVVVVLSDNCGYASDYYRWFTDRYQDFLYIDRIVVADWTRGRGVAQALYQEIDRLAQERRLAIAADVYSEPPNTPSLNFHRKVGFQEVGSQYFPAINKTAAKFMKYAEWVKPVEEG
ncbi:MAG: GNAT family N-acetyltransferase [Microcoleus sp.]